MGPLEDLQSCLHGSNKKFLLRRDRMLSFSLTEEVEITGSG